MSKNILRKNIVYKLLGKCDGANILFTIAENGSYKYHKNGSISIHWSGNRLYSGDGYGISEGHLNQIYTANPKEELYYKACVKTGKIIDDMLWY